MLGKHCIAELYGCVNPELDNLEYIEEVIKGAVKEAGATLLGISKHKFDPQGITLVALLSESHISFHSWPEMQPNVVAIDVFTCGEAIPERAVFHIIEQLQPERYELNSLKREYNP